MPKTCRKCNEEFPFRVEIDGKIRNLKNRKFCLQCSPFGKHNTRKLDESGEGAWCSKCNSTKPLVEFYTRQRGGPSGYCKSCANTLSVARWRENKNKAIAYLGGGCYVCGYDKCNAALEFHHRDPTKKDFAISRQRSLDKIKAELDKCVLLCANCHRETHDGLHPEIRL